MLKMEDNKEELEKPKKAKKPKHTKKTYTLKIHVPINGKMLSPGDKVQLTEVGAKDFKYKNRI